MSFTCYYECVDGKWYGDPRWFGEDWIIYLDEDACWLWLKVGAIINPEAILNDVVKIRYKDLKFSHCQSRPFYPRHKQHQAGVYKFTLLGKIPKPMMPEFGKATKKAIFCYHVTTNE